MFVIGHLILTRHTDPNMLHLTDITDILKCVLGLIKVRNLFASMECALLGNGILKHEYVIVLSFPYQSTIFYIISCFLQHYNNCSIMVGHK